MHAGLARAVLHLREDARSGSQRAKAGDECMLFVRASRSPSRQLAYIDLLPPAHALVLAPFGHLGSSRETILAVAAFLCLFRPP